MALIYEADSDLGFLEELTNEELDLLVTVLTKDKDGEDRFITGDLANERRYIRHEPDHGKYWDLIAAEYLEYGSHTFGKTRTYRQILTSVCEKLKVNFNEKQKVEVIEGFLIQKTLSDSLDGFSEDELKAFCDELKLKPTSLTPAGVVAALQAAISVGGFAPYQGAVIVLHGVATAFNTVLPFIAYQTLTRFLSILAGPIGLVINAALTVAALGGPAFRVVIPATIVIACLRRVHAKRNSDAAQKPTPDNDNANA